MATRIDAPPSMADSPIFIALCERFGYAPNPVTPELVLARRQIISILKGRGRQAQPATLDWTKPLELDDGTWVELCKTGDTAVYPLDAQGRDEDGHYWIRRCDGLDFDHEHFARLARACIPPGCALEQHVRNRVPIDWSGPLVFADGSLAEVVRVSEYRGAVDYYTVATADRQDFSAPLKALMPNNGSGTAGSNEVYLRPDGSFWDGNRYTTQLVRNVEPIDWLKPIELWDGTPAKAVTKGSHRRIEREDGQDFSNAQRDGIGRSLANSVVVDKAGVRAGIKRIAGTVTFLVRNRK